MQKKLIALAVAGLVSTGAFAQSAVTVYGVADLSFDSVSTSGGATPNVDTKTGSYSRVSSNSSYIGFKGTEDLGNGLKALFQFETGVNADAGNAAMFGNSRDTFAGLAGAFGNIKLGTLTTPTRALGTAIDVNAGATSIGANSGLINGAGFDTRQGNVVQYSSPSFSGFSGALAYVSGENKNIGANNGCTGVNTPAAHVPACTAAEANRSAWDLGVNYNNGPVLVGLTYVQDKARDVVDTQAKNTRIAGAYDFGVGSVRALWNSYKNETSTTSTKQNVWGLGGTFNAAPNGKVIAQYYKLNNISGTCTLALPACNDATGAKLFELGYEHSFSKRTMLKVIYARINNDDAAAFNFGGGNGVNNVTGNPGVDPSGFQIGIRHSF